MAMGPRVRGDDDGDGDDEKNAPVSRSVSAFGQYLPMRLAESGGGFVRRAVNDLRLCAGRDRNAARLLGLGDLADEIDVEQAVLKRSVLHLDEIGELEDALEGT